MKYTALGEGLVTNIALGEIQTKQQCFKCFIVFYTTDV